MQADLERNEEEIQPDLQSTQATTTATTSGPNSANPSSAQPDPTANPVEIQPPFRWSTIVPPLSPPMRNDDSSEELDIATMPLQLKPEEIDSLLSTPIDQILNLSEAIQESYMTLRGTHKKLITGTLLNPNGYEDREDYINLVQEVITRSTPGLINAVDLDSVLCEESRGKWIIKVGVFGNGNARDIVNARQTPSIEISWDQDITIPAGSTDSIPLFGPKSKGRYSSQDLLAAIKKLDRDILDSDIAAVSLRDHVTTIFTTRMEAAVKIANVGWFLVSSHLAEGHSARFIMQRDFKDSFKCIKIGNFNAAPDSRVLTAVLNRRLARAGSASTVAFIELPRNVKREFYGYALVYLKGPDDTITKNALTGDICGNKISIKERARKPVNNHRG